MKKLWVQSFSDQAMQPMKLPDRDVIRWSDKRRRQAAETPCQALHASDVQEKEEFREFIRGVEQELQSTATGMCLHIVRDHIHSPNSSISSVARLLSKAQEKLQERYDSLERETEVIDNERKSLCDEVQMLRRDKQRVTRLVSEQQIMKLELNYAERESTQWNQTCCERKDQINDMMAQYGETLKGMQSLYEEKIDKLKQDLAHNETINKQVQDDQAEDNPGTPDRPHNHTEEFVDLTDEPYTSYKGETMEALEQRFEYCKKKLLHPNVILALNGSLKPSGCKRKPGDSDADYKMKLYKKRRDCMDSTWKRVSPSNFHAYMKLMDELKNSKKRQKTLRDLGFA
jgi:chromosome segregation ATPase